MHRTLTLFIGLALLAGCRPYYISSNFDSVTAQHKVVAVLPVEMIFTGKQPKDITPEQIAEIEEGESRAFQISLYNEILASTRGGKKGFRIDFQSFSQTNALLAEAGISLRDSWSRTPEELAGILGVDAVVRESVQKHRYMSDLASYGIHVATEVVNILTNGALWPFIPGSIQKTYDINANCVVNNGADGLVLWNMAHKAQTDWSLPANQIIDGINYQFARRFPYRLKK